MQKYFNSLYSARRSTKIPRISHPPRRVGCGGWDKIKIYLRILIKCAIFA